MPRKKDLSQALNEKYNLSIAWEKLRKEDLEQIAKLFLDNKALGRIILRSEIEERRKNGPIISLLRDTISKVVLNKL